MELRNLLCPKHRLRVRVRFDRARLKMKPRLPKRFCQVCSLREGAGVMVTVIQLTTATVLVMATLSLTIMRPEVDKWWTTKLDRDFKPWFGTEKDSDGYSESYKNAWTPVAWAVVTICSVYFLSGVGVLVGVAKKRAHPNWFLPWLIVTVILMVTSLSFIAFAVALIIIFSFSREVTITADVVPTFLTSAFTCIWIYAFIVVLAHWKKTKRQRVALKLMASALATRAAHDMQRGWRG